MKGCVNSGASLQTSKLIIEQIFKMYFKIKMSDGTQKETTGIKISDNFFAHMEDGVWFTTHIFTGYKLIKCGFDSLDNCIYFVDTLEQFYDLEVFEIGAMPFSEKVSEYLVKFGSYERPLKKRDITILKNKIKEV